MSTQFLKFGLRDVFWLTVVLAVLLMWGREHRRLRAVQDELKAERALGLAADLEKYGEYGVEAVIRQAEIIHLQGQLHTLNSVAADSAQIDQLQQQIANHRSQFDRLVDLMRSKYGSVPVVSKIHTN